MRCSIYLRNNIGDSQGYYFNKISNSKKIRTIRTNEKLIFPDERIVMRSILLGWIPIICQTCYSHFFLRHCLKLKTDLSALSYNLELTMSECAVIATSIFDHQQLFFLCGNSCATLFRDFVLWFLREKVPGFPWIESANVFKSKFFSPPILKCVKWAQ